MYHQLKGLVWLTPNWGVELRATILELKHSTLPVVYVTMRLTCTLLCEHGANSGIDRHVFLLSEQQFPSLDDAKVAAETALILVAKQPWVCSEEYIDSHGNDGRQERIRAFARCDPS